MGFFNKVGSLFNKVKKGVNTVSQKIGEVGQSVGRKVGGTMSDIGRKVGEFVDSDGVRAAVSVIDKIPITRGIAGMVRDGVSKGADIVRGVGDELTYLSRDGGTLDMMKNGASADKVIGSAIGDGQRVMENGRMLRDEYRNMRGGR